MPIGRPAPSPAQPPLSAGEGLARALTEVAAGGASPAVSQQIERLLAEGRDRVALALACARFHDQLSERFPELAELLAAALVEAGIQEVRPDGLPFDGELHEAVDTTPTDDPDAHDTVAETVRAGYLDGDQVLRVPQVVVYRREPPS
ncbi:hypothetical protein Aple_017140 [Acrocarpospora pleiomorpha]|uniref:Nucleotide exchange factor GrpE n=1 Tax=Acrocarpospora pleiomorpha TaxID=90975 RepID=A0A5M3XFA9_9ACTN|nr:nucleotide exchange factor GrpE [Acrocarpospora pleiomorpha]GES18819.1 hypothetical protein Aple_017140 [Acrocarpospora pleiomorpha]